MDEWMNEWMDEWINEWSVCGCLLYSQEQICEMYQNLYDAGLQDQLSRFEDILVAVIKDVRKQQCENDRLERSYRRYTHHRHLKSV